MGINRMLIGDASREHAALVAVAEAAEKFVSEFQAGNRPSVSTDQFFCMMVSVRNDCRAALANLAAVRGK